MKVEKKVIIAEIIRTAGENDGNPLGQRKFETETGIKILDWKGKHWSKWGDALIEAGFQPNTLNEAYGEETLLGKLIDLSREIGKFPSADDIRFKAYNQKPFPSDTTFKNLGNQQQRIVKVAAYCHDREGFADILEICLPLLRSETDNVVKEDTVATKSLSLYIS